MVARPMAGRAIHLIGIGGAGMSGLAIVANSLGASVTGSDGAESPYLGPVRDAGIRVALGHDAANVPPDAEVVVSTAIPDANPELAAARAAGARVLHRSELLGELSRLSKAIAVSGTHGKTTTSAMIAHVMIACGRDPAYVIGGQLRSTGRNAAWGDGGWIVLEADESDRSFLGLGRDIAVITNVELDHHSTYGSLHELEAAFEEFAAPAELRVVGPGVTAGGEDERLTYDIGGGDLAATGVELDALGAGFTAAGVRFRLAVPGRHNVLNALAAIAACRAAGVEPAEAAPALLGFTGTARRFEEHAGGPAGTRVFDDYAHHPTEVRATLEAARTLGARRVIACFQPHLYSRTQELAAEFGAALALADVVVVLDIYPARERAEDFPGVSGRLIAAAAAAAGRGRPVWWLPQPSDAEAMLRSQLRAGDVVLTLGAGNVDGLARSLTTGGEAS